MDVDIGVSLFPAPDLLDPGGEDLSVPIQGNEVKAG